MGGAGAGVGGKATAAANTLFDRVKSVAGPLNKTLTTTMPMLTDMEAALGTITGALSKPLPILDKMSGLMQRVGKLDAVTILTKRLERARKVRPPGDCPPAVTRMLPNLCPRSLVRQPSFSSL